MKILSTVILLSTLSLTANASFMIENCTNAEGTISTTFGHVKPTVTISEDNVRMGSEGGYNRIELNRSDIDMVTSDVKELSKNVVRSCSANGFGHASFTSISSQKITITNKDGSTFGNNIANRTANGEAVEDYVICKREISNIVRCD